MSRRGSTDHNTIENGDILNFDTEDLEDALKQHKNHKELFSWIKTFVIAIVIVLVLTQVVIINARVPTGSMENTIMAGDRLIGLRLAYIKGEPQRGDIILFKYPVNESETYIKRVIGEAGDTVTIRDGQIYINDSETPYEEPYLKEEWLLNNDGYVFVVPDESVFVMGDNRNYSEDGRFWAEKAIMEGLADTEQEAEQYSYVSYDKIQGKALFTYFRSFKNLMDTGTE